MSDISQPSSGEIKIQLECILSSPGFKQSEQLSRFLRYVVEKYLDGNQDRLKEFTIATEVFLKDENFDPRLDSIVRVEAGRLRAKLNEYYNTKGNDDPIKIEIPKGHYSPMFSIQSESALNAKHLNTIDTENNKHTYLTRIKYSILGILALLVIVIGVNYFSSDNIEIIESNITIPVTTKHSIAVLPLRNMSGDPAHYYFSDGMTDALITSLAKNTSMRVTSMTSIVRYRDADSPITEIAMELNVENILEGSVLFDGDRVRISVQLINGTTGVHLWAQSYERDITNVISVQDEVAHKVAQVLTGEIIQQISKSDIQTINPDAYESYLKARHFKNQYTEDGFLKGVKYFQNTLDKMPNYAPAYSGMASCYCLLGGHGFELVKPAEGMPAAKSAVLRAIALDDSLAEAHAFLGIIKLKYDWDWSGAESSFKRAIDMNPSLAQAHLFYSIYLEAMGRKHEAIVEAERARDLDPLSLSSNVNLGWQLYQAGNIERALSQFEQTREIQPEFWGAYWGLAHIYRSKGMYDEAIVATQQAIASKGGHTLPLTFLGYLYAISGNHDEAKKTIDTLKSISIDRYVSPFNIATIYAGLNDSELTLEWLEKAYLDRSRSLAWLRVNKDFDAFRDDPKFNQLLQRIGLL